VLHEITDLQAATLGTLEILGLPFNNKTMDLPDEKLFLGQPVVIGVAEGTFPRLGGSGGIRVNIGQHIFVATEIKISNKTARVAAHFGKLQASTGVLESTLLAKLSDLKECQKLAAEQPRFEGCSLGETQDLH
jgi:hypothetical protein